MLLPVCSRRIFRTLCLLILLCQALPVLAQEYGALLYSGDYHLNGLYGMVSNTRYSVYEQAVVNDNSQSVFRLVRENADGSRLYKGGEFVYGWTELHVNGEYDIVEKQIMDTGFMPYVGRITTVLVQNNYVKGYVEPPQLTPVYILPVPLYGYYPYYTPPPPPAYPPYNPYRHR